MDGRKLPSLQPLINLGIGAVLSALLMVGLWFGADLRNMTGGAEAMLYFGISVAAMLGIVAIGMVIANVLSGKRPRRMLQAAIANGRRTTCRILDVRRHVSYAHRRRFENNMVDLSFNLGGTQDEQVTINNIGRRAHRELHKLVGQNTEFIVDAETMTFLIPKTHP